MIRSYIQGWLLLPLQTRLGMIFIGLGLGLGVGTIVISLRQSDSIKTPVSISIKDRNATNSAEINETELIVGVVGSVQKPGIYSVKQGSRVADVIAKAGGIEGLGEAEDPIMKLNIAEKVRDGQTIVVGGSSIVNDAKVNDTKKVRINTATKAEIDLIPGIGEKYTEELLQKRPFISTQDMQEKTNIPDGVLSKIGGYINYENE